MNDRFRFRGWHKELKQMSEVEGLYPYEDANAKNGEVFLYLNNKNSYYFPEEVEVMQCTGLKDKNGKLIYEGDIIKDFYCKGVITWNQFSWTIKYLDKKNRYVLPYDANINSWEIIGNIYENKELLDES